ncbi:hypothetical protein KW782_04475 [Candidatus Parcubacteria bacterium]|nr:hypothetical protein [Candidatus Parcubacteria bacterium]
MKKAKILFKKLFFVNSALLVIVIGIIYFADSKYEGQAYLDFLPKMQIVFVVVAVFVILSFLFWIGLDVAYRRKLENTLKELELRKMNNVPIQKPKNNQQ